MSKSLRKAQEITDAKIQFVSLVDKAANQRSFLLTKAEDGTANFVTYGRILKVDEKTHYVTGVVYEPMVEDSQGNFMTEDEITKAAYWYAKHGDEVDIQHSFEPFDGAKVVETWVAKADFSIGDEQVKKGTWLMTVEVNDPNIWKSIENKEITGFSMGGVGNYSEEDTDLSAVTKQGVAAKKRGLFKQLAEAMGFGVVEKGEMTTIYEQRSKGTLFWEAFSALQTVLQPYNPLTGSYEYETDEAKVREALTDFKAIITEVLAGGETIAKALQTDQPVEKAGRKMSASNRERLQGIVDSLGSFLSEFDDQPTTTNEEEDTVTKEMQDAIEQSVAAAVAKAMEGGTATPKTEPTPATAEPTAPQDGTAITQEAVEKMVAAAVAKAMNPGQPAQQQETDTVTAEAVQEMVAKAVAAAVEPILKAKGLPSNLGNEPVAKADEGEPHYLHGFL